MPRPSRTSALAASRRNTTMAVPSAGRIDSFGRVSKRVVPSHDKKTTVRPEAAERFLADKARKVQVVIDLPCMAPATSAIATTPTSAKTASSKRKRTADCDETQTTSTNTTATPAKRARRRVRTKTSSATAATAPITDYFSAHPTKKTVEEEEDDQITQQTGQLLARLNLQSSFSSPRAAFPSPPRSCSPSPQPSTAPTTPCDCTSESETSSSDPIPDLPVELVELLHLQAAFAKTLALHYTHNGYAKPVDLRVLCPNVAQAWGKRRVKVEDVQRCLGVAQEQTVKNEKSDKQPNSIVHALFLSEYGRGRVCIELQPDAAAPTSSLADQLTQRFAASLRAHWASSVAAQPDLTGKQCLDSLAKAALTKRVSFLQGPSARAQGQRSREELMQGVAQKKQDKLDKEAREAQLRAELMEMEVDVDVSKPAATAQNAPKTASNAPMSLLDRIRYRQLQRSRQQAGGTVLTPEQLERRAALHRVGDISEVLAALCSATSSSAAVGHLGRQQSRVSYGMGTLQTKLRDSLRQPISREEAASCVRLVAAEVAPEWVQIVNMAGREMVILLTACQPSKTTIESRVTSLVQ